MIFFKPLLTEPGFSLFVLLCFGLLVIILAGPRVQLHAAEALVSVGIPPKEAFNVE